MYFLYDICMMNKKELNQRIGERIIQLRNRRNWNQSALARACSKDRQAIEKIENGKVNATIFTLYEIAIALEVSLSELLEFT